MKIVVTGTRGIPDIQGGVETHCEELFPRLAAMGHDITVIRRSCYVNDNLTSYKGVKLANLFAPKKKSLEAIWHTYSAVLKARRMKADILHIHAVGPAIAVPFARMLGLKVVMTHHGPDYNRKKWGKLARTVIETGERWGVKNASRVIVISQVINDLIKNKYNRNDAALIFNGVNRPKKSQKTDYLESLGIGSRQYIVTLGRFVPEKGFHDLIKAYSDTDACRKGIKLVIAGDADHPDEYSESLKKMAKENGVVLTGFIKGEHLNQLMSNASLFVLPSYHEGLPIALLEAMSYDLDVLVSNIPANMIDELDPGDHFTVGDTNSLSQAIDRKIANPATPRVHDLSRYNWDNIARQTDQVYNSLIHQK